MGAHLNFPEGNGRRIGAANLKSPRKHGEHLGTVLQNSVDRSFGSFWKRILEEDSSGFQDFPEIPTFSESPSATVPRNPLGILGLRSILRLMARKENDIRPLRPNL